MRSRFVLLLSLLPLATHSRGKGVVVLVVGCWWEPDICGFILTEDAGKEGVSDERGVERDECSYKKGHENPSRWAMRLKILSH